MRLVVQRVKKASVSLHETGEIVGKIGQGLFVLVGLKKGDTEDDVRALSSKLLKLRIMADENMKMNLSVSETKGEYLVVSQFTLYGNAKDGNRPSFSESMEPEKAKKLYALLIDQLYEGGASVSTGSFGNYMDIESSLDGPVTIILET